MPYMYYIEEAKIEARILTKLMQAGIGRESRIVELFDTFEYNECY
jgi:hypothetical protein